jgi:hypothetical protein
MRGRDEDDAMRQLFFPVMAVSVLVLAGCGGPSVPESGAAGGVGFGDYQTYLKQREAALNNGTQMPASQTTVANAGAAIGAEPIAATSLGSVNPSDPLPAGILAAVPGGPVASADPVSAPLTTSTMLAQTTTSTTANVPIPSHTPGISDENSFDAVAGRQTIASDKERLAQMRANYQQIEPTALPERSGNTGPNLASYALAATNSVGQSVYPRGSFNLTSSERACNKFSSPDLAQSAFLTSGGPQKDSKNLDPDGDGFACTWDPRPFQAARAQ